MHSVVFPNLKTKRAVAEGIDSGLDFLCFRERRCTFSLGFRPIGPSVFDGVRRKVVLRGEGYTWARFSGVSTTPRGRDLFLLMLIFV